LICADDAIEARKRLDKSAVGGGDAHDLLDAVGGGDAHDLLDAVGGGDAHDLLDAVESGNMEALESVLQKLSYLDNHEVCKLAKSIKGRVEGRVEGAEDF
jgi:hypothetical protein